MSYCILVVSVVFLIPPCCTVSRWIALIMDSADAQAVGKWSMEEQLRYLFVAGGTAGCRESGSPLPPQRVNAGSECVATSVQMPEYVIVALQGLAECEPSATFANLIVKSRLESEIFQCFCAFLTFWAILRRIFHFLWCKAAWIPLQHQPGCSCLLIAICKCIYAE